MDWDDWDKEFDRRMREVDTRIHTTFRESERRIDEAMKQTEKRIREHQKYIQQTIAESQAKLEEEMKVLDKRAIDKRNEESDWVKRRVFVSKTCAETGEPIKSLSPAYFKDQWDYAGNKTRTWLSEEGYTWRVLRDDV